MNGIEIMENMVKELSIVVKFGILGVLIEIGCIFDEWGNIDESFDSVENYEKVIVVVNNDVLVVVVVNEKIKIKFE